MNIETQPTPGEEKPPAVKKQFVVLVSDPVGQIKESMAAWVLQIPENEHAGKVTRSIDDVAAAYNATKKGRLLPVVTVGEALENIPSKHFNDVETWVKTKTPVLVVMTDNMIGN